MGGRGLPKAARADQEHLEKVKGVRNGPALLVFQQMNRSGLSLGSIALGPLDEAAKENEDILIIASYSDTGKCFKKESSY